MQIILQKSVKNLGLVGDVVEVKPGYYRNFLSPRSLAVLADAGSVKAAEHLKKVIESKKAKEKANSEILKAKLEKHPIVISHTAGQGDKLFGSINAQEIVVALRQDGLDVDRKFVKLDAPIKTLGDHVVEIKLHPEVSANVTITVNRKGDPLVDEVKAEAAPKKARAPKAAKGDSPEAPQGEASTADSAKE